MTTKYFIYLGDNPTGFVGLEGNVKRNFMIALDEEKNKGRIKEFLKDGTLVAIPKSDFDHYENNGIDRKRNEVEKYLVQKQIPHKRRVKPLEIMQKNAKAEYKKDLEEDE